MKALSAVIALVIATAAPTAVLAWGGTGHRLIGLAAANALPAEIPDFLRTPQAIEDIGELALEPDNSKYSGKEHDLEMQSGHFVDIDEDGKILGGPPASPLPPTRDLYEKSLQAFGLNSWKAGYLPYSIFDRWQVLTKDFAIWRVVVAAEANPNWTEHHAYYVAQRRRREALILVGAGGFAYEEAAEICGVAVGTIKSRVARGRVALESILSGGDLSSRRHHSLEGRTALDTIMGEVDDLSRGR